MIDQDPRQIDIGDILGHLANGPRVGPHTNKIEELLRRFSSTGTKLSTLTDKRYLHRKLSTLKRYACAANLIFPDYCPRHLKPKKEKKRRANG